MLKLPGHARYGYSPIIKRPDYSWPQEKRLAFYVALNIEHFAFASVLGMDPFTTTSKAPGTTPGEITAVALDTGVCSKF